MCQTHLDRLFLYYYLFAKFKFQLVLFMKFIICFVLKQTRTSTRDFFGPNLFNQFALVGSKACKSYVFVSFLLFGQEFVFSLRGLQMATLKLIFFFCRNNNRRRWRVQRVASCNSWGLWLCADIGLNTLCSLPGRITFGIDHFDVT
jgi:hypothetical protein